MRKIVISLAVLMMTLALVPSASAKPRQADSEAATEARLSAERQVRDAFEVNADVCRSLEISALGAGDYGAYSAAVGQRVFWETMARVQDQQVMELQMRAKLDKTVRAMVEAADARAAREAAPKAGRRNGGRYVD